MKHRIISLFVVFLYALGYSAYAGDINGTHTQNLEAKARQWLQKKSSTDFLENCGQMMDTEGNPAPFALFKAETSNLNFWITGTGITLQTFKRAEKDEGHKCEAFSEPKIGEEEEKTYYWEQIEIELKGAIIKKDNIEKEGASITDFNYFYPHCSDGIYNVKKYNKITIREVYPDIDWIIYNSPKKGYKYDFIVHPDADYKQIELLYRSKTPIHINKQGELELYTAHGNIKEDTPVSFYEDKKIKTKFLVKYQKSIHIGQDQGYETSIKFNLEKPDKHRTSNLIIDPQLVWGTYFGGTVTDGFSSVKTDASGSIFVAGYVSSPGGGIPTLNPFNGAYFKGVTSGTEDVLILKFNNTGTLLWATFYGGSAVDFGVSLDTDLLGNVYVTGYTMSTNFPTSNWAGAYFNGGFSFGTDAYVLKFSNTGVRIWATYYGGTMNDLANCIAVDNLGNIFITGSTQSIFFPTFNSAGAYFQGFGTGTPDAFILKFSSTGVLLWSTIYGGSTGSEEATSIAIDQFNNIFITGAVASTDFPVKNMPGGYNQGGIAGLSDAFILKFANNGALSWASYYGGTADDRAESIAVDGVGNVFITGSTKSTDFPVLNLPGAYFQGANAGFSDIFVSKFSNAGVLNWATYYGGSNYDDFFGLRDSEVITDLCGNVYISGQTKSDDFPTLLGGNCGSYFNAMRTSSPGYVGFTDVFIVKFNNTGTLLWATYQGTYLGDFGGALAVDIYNNLIATGEWWASGSNGLKNPGSGAYYDATYNDTFFQGHDSYIMKFAPIVPSYTTAQTNSMICSPCSGSATITLTCGDKNYNYVWSNGSSTLNSTVASNTITGLCPGTYTVTVTSNCNQTQTTTFVITSIPCSNITANANSATICKGITPCPTLTAVGSSGTLPYTYNWSTGASTQNISPCPSTTTSYTVTVKDNTGVSATSTATMTVLPAVTATLTANAINCSGASTGSATATGGNGTSPYTFNWSNSGSGSIVSGLAEGTYTVTITDSKGCTATSTTVLVSPPPLLGQFTKGTAACANCGCQEWITATSAGGTPPYTYQWSDGYDKRYKNKVCPGNYTIKITDKNGCSVDVNVSTP